MAIILSIETATNVCSVALHNSGNLIGHVELHLEKSHSIYLTTMIEDMLKYCQISNNELNAIAISEGPGSYTGLRIGVSTAKGLAYSLGIPMIAVNTLKAMAHQLIRAIDKSTLLCPTIDARRMEVYSMLVNSEGKELEPVQPKIIDRNSYHKELSENKILFFGNGAQKCVDVIDNNNAIFAGKINPSAKTIGVIANIKFKNKDFVDVVYFEPFYLKDYKTTIPKTKL